MAIKIYELNEQTGLFSEVSSGSFANEIDIQAAPGGSSIKRKVFLRNDDAAKYYTGLTLSVRTPTDGDLPINGVTVKLLSGDQEPTSTDWAAAASNNSAALASPLSVPLNESIPELGEVGTADTAYYPFWIYTIIESSVPVEVTQWVLKMVYTEGNV